MGDAKRRHARGTRTVDRSTMNLSIHSRESTHRAARSERVIFSSAVAKEARTKVPRVTAP